MKPVKYHFSLNLMLIKNSRYMKNRKCAMPFNPISLNENVEYFCRLV